MLAASLLLFAALVSAESSASVNPSPTSIAAWTLPYATPITPADPSAFPLAANYSSNEIRQYDPRELAVAPLPFTSRNASSTQYAPQAKHPSRSDNSTAHFQVYDKAAAKEILGDSPEINLLIKGDDPEFQFAFEAPTYFPKEDAIFWAANPGQEGSNLTVNSQLFQIENLSDAIKAQKRLQRNGNSSSSGDLYDRFVKRVDTKSPAVQMMNGGTNYNGQWLTANTGRGSDMPSSLALVDTNNVTRVKTLLNNIAGVDFNSLDDLAVHPDSGAIFVTDPYYGPLKKYKPKPTIAPMTWVFSPLTGQTYPIEDTLLHPNGLAFSPDAKQVYITDSAPDFSGVYQDDYELLPSSVYVFDVHSTANGENAEAHDVTHHLSNKRLFSRPVTGIVDGIKVDRKGNVYGGSLDGVNVWSKTGKLIMTIFLPFGGTVNFAFANDGRLIVLQKSQIWYVQLNKDVSDPGLDKRPGKALGVDF